MIDLRISKILAKDLMSIKSKYIKNGNIEFNSIEIGLDSLDRTYIKFYSQEVLLASTIVAGQIGSFSTLTFKLNCGSMQMTVKDESSTNVFRERIEAAITEIREALDEKDEEDEEEI